MISVQTSGSFKKTNAFLMFFKADRISRILDKYGRIGVGLLSAATPKETGETAHSWTYTVEASRSGYAINWYNTHNVDGVNIAAIIQYGHGTGTGGWVKGIDYINPVIRPLFQKIADEVWREVTRA